MKTLLHLFKKIAIQSVVLLFVAVGYVADAQYPYEFLFAGLPHSSKTIVRSYNTENVVVYYEEGGRGVVALVNVLTNDVFKVPLDTGYLMNDMCILNDTVYLCGQEFHFQPPMRFGCVLFMNINDFYTGSVPVTYYEPAFYYYHMNYTRFKVFDYIGTSGSRFKKCVLVGEVDYACDGSEIFPHNLMYYGHNYIFPDNPSRCTMNVVMEANLVNYSSNNPVMRILNPPIHPEVVHDVVVTDNFVAFVGIVAGSVDSIALHVCNKNNYILNPIYPNPYPFNSYYTYPLGTSNGDPFYHACALEDDNIAIVTHNETSTNSPTISIRTINLATHVMTHSQELKCNAHPYLLDVAYIHNLQRLVIDFNDYFRPWGGSYDIFCTAYPYNVNASYVQKALTDNVYHLKMGSLDAMMGGYFVATGGKYGFSANAGGFASGKACYEVDDYTILKTSVINATPAYFSYDDNSPIDISWQDTLVSIQERVPSECIEIK